MTFRIFIVDEMHPSIIPDLKGYGFDVDYQPNINREEILRRIGNYTGIIIRSKTTIDQELLDKAINLKFVARAGAGIDKIDEVKCRLRNIRIINAPEGNRDALSEHAMGMLLALLNKIHTADHEIRQGNWNREGNRGIEIQGKTIGIIGYGNMGSAFAKRLSSFDCSVLAYDKYKHGFSDRFVKESTLDQIFLMVDILSFHVPLSDETLRMYNESFFKKFKKKLFVINTARGPILPIKDLLKTMDEGIILGAALDVLENEKLDSYTEQEKSDFENLIARKNVILTPHVGGWSKESYKKINDVLIEKITALLI